MRDLWASNSAFEITAMMNGMPLPTLDPDRGTALRSTWEARHRDLTMMKFEAQVRDQVGADAVLPVGGRLGWVG